MADREGFKALHSGVYAGSVYAADLLPDTAVIVDKLLHKNCAPKFKQDMADEIEKARHSDFFRATLGEILDVGVQVVDSKAAPHMFKPDNRGGYNVNTKVVWINEESKCKAGVLAHEGRHGLDAAIFYPLARWKPSSVKDVLLAGETNAWVAEAVVGFESGMKSHPDSVVISSMFRGFKEAGFSSGKSIPYARLGSALNTVGTMFLGSSVAKDTYARIAADVFVNRATQFASDPKEFTVAYRNNFRDKYEVADLSQINVIYMKSAELQGHVRGIRPLFETPVEQKTAVDFYTKAKRTDIAEDIMNNSETSVMALFRALCGNSK